MHRDSRVSQSQPLSSCLPSWLSVNRPVRRYIRYEHKHFGDLASCSEARKNSTPALGSFSNCPQRQCGVQGGSMTQKVLRQASTPVQHHDLARVLREARSQKKSTANMGGTMQLFSCRLRH